MTHEQHQALIAPLNRQESMASSMDEIGVVLADAITDEDLNRIESGEKETLRSEERRVGKEGEDALAWSCEPTRARTQDVLDSVVHFFFFFQAEDGIRDFHVTGVQTCALPIYMTHEQHQALIAPLNRQESMASSMDEIGVVLADAITDEDLNRIEIGEKETL